LTPAQRLRLLGGILAAAAATWLSWRIAAGTRIRGEPETLLRAIAVWWVVFAAGAACLLGVPRRWAVGVIVVGAVAMRVVALAGVPALSNDLDRYAWDGHVQAAGIDPYRYPPDAPELARLRVRWLFPDAATCRSSARDRGCIRISRPGDRTIYPPAAQAWFVAVHALAGDGGEDRTWQIAALLLDLATLAVMLALLRSWGRDVRFLVLYAWCPVAVTEAVQNGHVDGLATLLILGGLWAARRRPAVAGALLGLATLVKLYPALLVAALVLRRGWQRALAAFAAVIALGYLPHVIAVGPKVLGYLPGYLREENYAAGKRFLLLDAIGLAGTLAQVVAAGVVVLTAAWVVAERDALTVDVAARRLLGGLLLAATAVQPWYAVPLAAVAALEGAWWWLAVAAAGYPLFFRTLEKVPLPAWPAYQVGQLAYGTALAVVLAGGLLAARRRRLGVRRVRLRTEGRVGSRAAS
jgi:hypothetical protein